MHQRRVPQEDENRRVQEFEVPLQSPSSLVLAAVKRALASPKVQMTAVLWLVGILFMSGLAPALVKITPEMHEEYESMVQKAEDIPEYSEAVAKLAHADREVYNAQVWFWRFREPYRTTVYEKKEIANALQAVVDKLDASREGKLRDAKAFVGLWSEYGFLETRDKFWSAFESGKVFATRQTFWQMFYSVLSSREESVLSLILQWFFVAIVNFTLGLFGALFYFAVSLFYMIFSYNPNPLSATAFYLLAFLGGASMVATVLFAIYAAAAGSVFVLGRVIVRQAALEQERRRQIPNQQYQQQRQHQHHM